MSYLELYLLTALLTVLFGTAVFRGLWGWYYGRLRGNFPALPAGGDMSSDPFLSGFRFRDVWFALLPFLEMMLFPLAVLYVMGPAIMQMDGKHIPLGAIAGEFVVRLLLCLPLFLRLTGRDLGPGTGWGLPSGRVLGKWVLIVLGTGAALTLFDYTTDFSRWFSGALGSTQDPSELIRGILSVSWEGKVVLFSLIVLIGPFIEEILFRAYLYRLLRQVAGVWFSIILVSLLFGLIHLFLPGMVVYAALGIVLNLAYEKTRCLWVPIVMHSVYNAFAVIFTLVFE